MPTTITRAGMVSGRRQRNSTVRDIPGTRRRTQIIVGTSSATIRTTVKTASSRDETMASRRSSFSTRATQASEVRPVASPLARVLKSSIESRGSAK